MLKALTYDIDIHKAHLVLKNIVLKTPLQFHRKLSEKFGCEVYLKREEIGRAHV